MFEYTEEHIVNKFRREDGQPRFDLLVTYPCIFCEEGKSDEVAYIGYINRLRVSGEVLFLEISLDEKIPEIRNSIMHKNKKDLDMIDIEFSRNHWAVKEVDLYKFLFQKAGLKFLEETNQVAEGYFNRAFKSYTKGNYDSAIEDYTEGLRLQSNDVYAWLNRGNAWSRKGEYDKAIADYSRAIHLEPGFAAAWSGRGEAWCKKGEYDKAIDDLNEALRLSPNSSNAWRVRGLAWRKMGEYDKAIADYKEALRFFPEDEEIKQSLNVALALQASGSEREEIIENLKSEYGRDLKEQMNKSLGQILKDREGFISAYKTNKRVSFYLRISAVILLLIIAFVWVYLFARTYNFDMQELQLFGPSVFLHRAPVFTTLTAPFLLLIWLLLRWGYETKTVSYAFHRKALLEERIVLYFNNDTEKLKDMQELFVAHWMEKSPLEVMLAIGGKRKHGGETPVDALSGKLEELINRLKTRAGKDGS